MISVLDHLTLAGSQQTYEALLGRRAVDGRLQTSNVGLTFSSGGAALSAMVFSTPALDKAASLLERRAVPATRGAMLELSATATHGVPIALVERSDRPAPSPAIVDWAAGSRGGIEYKAGPKRIG